MSRSRAQRRLQDRGALAHLRSRRLIAELLEHAMVDRVRADRDQRVGGKLGDLRPAHAQLVAERAQLDPVAGGKIADHVTQFFLGLAAAQPPIQRIEQILLLLDGAAVEAAILIVDDEPDALLAGDDGFQRQPPQLAQPVRETRRNVDRERYSMPPQNRIGETQRVAIAVVEGEAGEAPREIARAEPAMHLVERDELDAGTANGFDRRFQEPGRDLQQPVRLEAVVAARAHVMQGQDRADPADERAQPAMAAFPCGAIKPSTGSPSPSRSRAAWAGPRLARSLKVSTTDLRFDWPFAPCPLASASRGIRTGEWRERDHGQVPEYGARAFDRNRNRPGGLRPTSPNVDLLTLPTLSTRARLVEERSLAGGERVVRDRHRYCRLGSSVCKAPAAAFHTARSRAAAGAPIIHRQANGPLRCWPASRRRRHL